MKTYIATSLKFTGGVEYTFNAEGILVCIDMRDATLTEEQRLYLWFNRPRSVNHVETFAVAASLMITEKLVEITFEQFYEAYGYKEGRKKAETAWNRLSKAEQLKAYQYIATIKTKKQISGQALQYPASYLNSARWND
jgi:hypothetical protein